MEKGSKNMPCCQPSERGTSENYFPPWYKKGKEKTYDEDDSAEIDEENITIEGELKKIDSYDVNTGEGIKGLAIIMTNDFEDRNKLQLSGKPDLSPLPFVLKDGQKLWNMFRSLNFDVIWHTNTDAKKMFEKLKEDLLSATDVGKMIVCCISSHGEPSIIFGQDGKPVFIKSFVDQLSSGNDDEIKERLLGKPKLFFIDACQGEYSVPVSGEDITVKKYDITQDFSRIAEHADVLLGFAAYQGTTALGNKDGSYYINELVKYLSLYHETEDIQVILAAVCRAVQSFLSEGSDLQSCQLPMVLSTLRKRLVISGDRHRYGHE